jgi:hypothetical protein
LKEGPIETTPDPPRVLFPGDRQFLTFNDGTVELWGTGSADEEGRVESFALYGTDMVLFPPQPLALEAGASVPHVQLAGDLDRDGRLDFLVSTSNHYNVHELTLFLSNGTTTGVRPVAVWRTTGC